jgi:hypothetical protein
MAISDATVLDFGYGMVGFYPSRLSSESVYREVDFFRAKEPHEPGSIDESSIDKPVGDDVILRFRFLTPESVQSVIDALDEIKESLSQSESVSLLCGSEVQL